jgi:hypothetical protein
LALLGCAILKAAGQGRFRWERNLSLQIGHLKLVILEMANDK